MYADLEFDAPCIIGCGCKVVSVIRCGNESCPVEEFAWVIMMCEVKVRKMMDKVNCVFYRFTVKLKLRA
jgi:hypothetical protein